MAAVPLTEYCQVSLLPVTLSGGAVGGQSVLPAQTQSLRTRHARTSGLILEDAFTDRLVIRRRTRFCEPALVHQNRQNLFSLFTLAKEHLLHHANGAIHLTFAGFPPGPFLSGCHDFTWFTLGITATVRASSGKDNADVLISPTSSAT